MKVATVSEARISDREKQLQRLLRQGLLSRDAIEGKVVLDWECGDAAFAVAFSRLGASKVYAIDSWVKFDDEYVDQLTQLNVVAQNISIREFSSVATAKADLIFANTVTEHLQDLPSAFQNVFGLLKPNGYFFCSHDNYYHPSGSHDHGFVKTHQDRIEILSSACWTLPTKCEASKQHRDELRRARPFQWTSDNDSQCDPSNCAACPYYLRSQPWAHIRFQKDFRRIFPKSMNIGGSLNKITPFQLRQLFVEAGFVIRTENRSRTDVIPPPEVLQADPTLTPELLQTWMVKITAQRSR